LSALFEIAAYITLKFFLGGFRNTGISVSRKVDQEPIFINNEVIDELCFSRS